MAEGLALSDKELLKMVLYMLRALMEKSRPKMQ